jgi:hypothetical protein
MKALFGIELIDSGYHVIIEPFLEVVSSFVEKQSTVYIFSSLMDAKYISNELDNLDVVEEFHELYLLNKPNVWPNFDDYGFQTQHGHVYIFKSMVSFFTIQSGLEMDKEQALLQFDEHLIARENSTYVVDLHHQELIEKIAKAYNISVNFFELDK